MRLGILFALLTCLACGQARANPLFGYTHRLPSPRTLPMGRLVYGTDVALGVTDFLQVGTNIVLDFYKIWNVEGKVSLIDYPDFALTPTLGFESYNYKDIADTNPDLRVTAWKPGAVAAYALLDDLAWFVGGNLNLTSTRLVTSGIETSGYVTGAEAESDLSWAYNRPEPVKSKRALRRPVGVGNVLSGGISWDFNYKLFGIGISHHWPGFHVGVHYFPNADRQKLEPILAGGGAVDF